MLAKMSHLGTLKCFISWTSSSMVEQQPFKPLVLGSSPSWSTEIKNQLGVVVQLVRMLACHAGGRGFESRPSRN